MARLTSVFLASTLLLSLISSASAHAGAFGYRGLKNLDEQLLLAQNPSWPVADVAKAIEKYLVGDFANRDLQGSAQYDAKLSNARLSRMLARISDCFGIDAFVFTAMVRQESIQFNRAAVSRTGATGLTQMTASGLQEVDEQFGFGENGGALTGRFADPEAVRYFQGVLNSCVSPTLYDRPEWSHLWRRAAVKAHAAKSAEWYAAQKRIVVEDPIVSLVYGAALLKVYVANAQNQLPGADARAIYSRALKTYNGAPREREAYVRNIMGAHLPRILEAGDAR